MPLADIIAEKKRLRAHFLALRAQIPTAKKAALDAALCRSVAAHPAFAACDVLLCFAPVRDEPDLTDLYRLARELNKQTAFPRCTGTQMSFHTVASEDALEKGRFGIPTPKKEAPLAALGSRTLCLVPALSATRDGARLGYGGGFYDRFLESFPGISLLPLYSALVCDTLPLEPTDQVIRHILTEKGELPQDA